MTQEHADTVMLVELDETSFREFRKHLVRDYAADKVRAGVWSADDAEERAERDVEGLLPAGTATRGHFLYSVRDELVPAEVGMLWISVLAR
jgi:hypothetical protein